MAHELEIIDGKASFFETSATGKKLSWHKLGICVKDAPSSEDAMRLAKLDWQVESKPIFHDMDLPAIKGFKANVRKDNGATLGIVSDSYKIRQNSECFDFMDGLIRDGIARYETAGVIDGGKRVFALMQARGQTKIADSVQVPYCLITNGHDGKNAVRVVPTSVRVVCANTVAMALNTQAKLTFTHDAKMDVKMKVAQELMDSFATDWADWVSKAKQLTARHVTRDGFVDLLHALYPKPEEKLGGDGKAVDRHAMKMAEIIRIWKDEPTQQNIKDTAWGAYNAVTFFENHVSGKASDQNRALRAIEGTGDTVMRKAWNLLTA